MLPVKETRLASSLLALALVLPASGHASQAPAVRPPDEQEIAALEHDAVAPTLDHPAPARLSAVEPAWPEPITERWRFRVHLILDETGRVAEARIVRTLVGDRRAPDLPPGIWPSPDRYPPTTLARAAVLGAVRQWRFAPPSRAPMLIVTEVGVADDPPDPRADGEPRPLRVGGDLPPPRKVLNVPPRYPADALAARISGLVIIRAVIDASGAVTDARVVSGVPLLDDAALEAVRQWRYEPARLNGEPVPVVMTVTVNFSLAPPGQ